MNRSAAIRSAGVALLASPLLAQNAEISGSTASTADLTSKLSRLLGRPVINHTGLEGNYDSKLEWTPDLGPPAHGEPAETSVGPSLFSALQQQLGLRLEATKGPVDVLVIDHVDKPSDN